MNTQIIHLSDDDSAHFVIAKIGIEDLPRVLLVIPDHWNGGRLDFLLILRKSRLVNKQLALVTRQREIVTIAVQLNIPTFSTVDEAQKQSWRRWYGRRLNKARNNKNESKKNLAGLLTKIRPEINEPLYENKWKRVTFFIIGVVAVLLLVLIFLPEASIFLDIKENMQKISFDIWANPSIKEIALSGGVPASIDLIEVEGHTTGKSSGQVTVPENYATGRVKFTNLSSTTMNIAYGTIIQTTDSPPIGYKVLNSIDIPPGEDKGTYVEIQSVVPGSQGNVGEGKISVISGSQGLFLSVTNSEAITGGTDRMSSSPNENDYEMLQRKLLAELEGKALDEMMSSVKSHDLMVVPQTIKLEKIIEKNMEPKLGVPADFLSLKIKAIFSVWSVKVKDIETLALYVLDAGVPVGYVPDNSTFVLETDQTPDFYGEDVHYQVSARRLIRQEIPTKFSQTLAGMNKNQAESVLSDYFNLDSPPYIKLEPSWMPNLPLFPFKIKITTL